MKLRELLQQMQETQKETKSSQPYLTGGTPRDQYLQHLENIADLDVTNGDKTINVLSSAFAEKLGGKYNIVHREMTDGHSAIHIGSFKIDFSSNFNAPNIDKLLFQRGIINPTDMQKEMFSRDFTCNALLLSLDLKELIDPTKNGFKDIKERKIRTCLPPEITLTTNRNRVIRAIYLACKLDFDVDKDIIDFVAKNPSTVKIATNKVLVEKLNDAFTKNSEKANKLITQMNLWNYIPITEKVYPYYMKRDK